MFWVGFLVGIVFSIVGGLIAVLVASHFAEQEARAKKEFYDAMERTAGGNTYRA